MTLSRIGSVLALLAIFCVVAVFFCHSMQGPYSAVHGPVTALLSVRASAGLRLAIVHAGSIAPGFSAAIPLGPLSILEVPLASPDRQVLVPGPDLTLRC